MSSRVTIEYVRDLERRIASLEQRMNSLASLVEGPPPWDDLDDELEEDDNAGN